MKRVVEVCLGIYLLLMVLSFLPVVVGVLIGLLFGIGVVFGTYFLIRLLLG